MTTSRRMFIRTHPSRPLDLRAALALGREGWGTRRSLDIRPSTRKAGACRGPRCRPPQEWRTRSGWEQQDITANPQGPAKLRRPWATSREMAEVKSNCGCGVVLLDVGLQEAEDERPAAVAGAQGFGDEPGMREAHGGDAAGFPELHANDGLGGVLVSTADPGKHEQAGPFDFEVFTAHGEGPCVAADAAHHPDAAGAQIGFHIGGLEKAG